MPDGHHQLKPCTCRWPVMVALHVCSERYMMKTYSHWCCTWTQVAWMDSPPILITKKYSAGWFLSFSSVFMEVFLYWQLLLLNCSLGKVFRSRTCFLWRTHFWTFFRTPLSSNSSFAKCSSPKQFFNKTVPFLNCCCVDPLLSTPIQYPKRPIADFFVHWIALLPYSPEPMLYWIAPLSICSFELPWIAFFVLNHSIYSIYWFVLWLKCDLLEKVPHWTSLNHSFPELCATKGGSTVFFLLGGFFICKRPCVGIFQLL